MGKPNSTCSVTSCEKAGKITGLCGMHYYRVRKYNSLLLPPKIWDPANLVCEVEGCESKRGGTRFCYRHYKRYQVHGDTEAYFGPSRKPLKFLQKINSDNGVDACIEWPFNTNVSGYGKLKVNGRTIGAHRYSLMLATMEDPSSDTLACHTCCNVACVNPRHLYWGSHKDNAQDMINDGNSMRGMKSKNAKITDDIAIMIFNDPRTRQEIGDDYGVSSVTVSYIKLGKTWGHITGKEYKKPPPRKFLSPIQVMAIYRDTRTQSVIASHYGVCIATVSNIKTGRSWIKLTNHC